MMKAKVCFNDEIHRISNVPESLHELKKLVRSTFKNKLPELWTFQYKDLDEDNIVISEDKDFEEFRNFGAQANKGSSVMKIYVVPFDELKVSREKSDVIIQKPESDSEEEDYQIIEDAPETNDDLAHTQIIKSEKEDENIIIEEHSPKLEEKEKVNIITQTEKFEEQKIEFPHQENDSDQTEKTNTEENKNVQPNVHASREKDLVNVEIIEKMMSSAIEKSLPQIIQSTTEEPSLENYKKESVNKAVHHGISCTRCGVMPIIGIRYKCSVCPNFDCCEICEESCPHIHNFIKIKDYNILDNFSENEVPKPNPFGKEKKSGQKKKFEPMKEEPKPGYVEKNEYFHALKDKAQKLQKCFPKVEFEILLAYVNGAPEDLSLEELIENFKH